MQYTKSRSPRGAENTHVRSPRAAIAIVGTGIAAVQAAAALRKGGYAEELILIGAEPHLPYNRPPLSKDVLQSRLAPSRILLRPESFYSANRIELRTGTPVTHIHRQAQRVELADGAQVGYSKLLLATGSTPSPLPVLPDRQPGCLLPALAGRRAGTARAAHAPVPGWSSSAAASSASRLPPPRSRRAAR